ncbi:sensor histidine kinase [Blautia sp. Marseille-P3201T]|uniref:sensor histidine kinase n=1 Tax=Blautia sp. Marseille-P3201T TaxID=1907659 RepID=UPI0009302FF8|nr:HAMP domain-containing sensor histidine kinase [Blautia sp. Marseille-P3201T]
MKFRYKVTLCMISMIAFIFGIGGTFLLYSSFQSSINREKMAAIKTFDMVLHTFSLLSQETAWTTASEISNDFGKIVEQNDLFAAISLHKDKELIYKSSDFVNNMEEMGDKADYGNVAYKIIRSENNSYIQLCSVIKAENVDLYIDALYDVTKVYEQREELQRLYIAVFLLVVTCSAVLSYILSYFLTKPISRLKKIVSSITQGNYDLRSDIHTNDEIEELSAEFNQMTDTLVDKMEELNNAVDRQNQFIANFTHELKTPMTSMIGYADLLRRQNLSLEEQIDAANYIYSESKRLERLSIKLLELIAADNKNQELTVQNPAYLIDSVVKHSISYFKENGIEIEKKCEAGNCMLEPDLFVSLVINLLENARRAMENGGVIKIMLSMTEEGCDLLIQDTGCGIPKDKLVHLTEAFYRIDKARSRSFGGAGLGLSLCDRIAKIHNGSLSVESEVGIGTSVKVQIRGGRK